jgi:flagellar biosynthesis protein FlhG
MTIKNDSVKIPKKLQEFNRFQAPACVRILYKPVPMSAKEKIPELSVHHSPQKTIWAVGGGKGGTGKSFIAANLAIHLASLEKDVVLIDADLGGPNLHTFLGMNDARLDLGHFFTNKVSRLEETMAFTPIDGLRLIRGTDQIPFMANLNYYKKLKFIRHVKAFDAKRVIIDIGTGASLNYLDFFILSNPGILVVNPEPTSIENAYYFLKSCILRILKSYIEHYKLKDLIRRIADQMDGHSKSIYSFFNTLISLDKSYAQVLYKALSKFNPCLIMNKARSEKDYLLGESMADVVQKYLAIKIRYLGTIPYDENIQLSLKKLSPYLSTFSDSRASLSLREIAERLVKSNP